MASTPILLLIYNRKDLAARVVQRILQSDPIALYVAGDGAKSIADRASVEETRDAVLAAIPDDVDVHTLFRDENLGCKRAVESAISWFFSQVPQGIILEDDCLPGDSFIPFCEAMLDRYEDTADVMHISGYSHCPEASDGYYFGRIPAVWGWATWADSWNRYESSVPRMDKNTRSQLRGGFGSRAELQYYADRFDDVATGSLDSWAFAWTFSVVSHHGLCIRPYRNLVQNIGIEDQRATHPARRRTSSNLASIMNSTDTVPMFKVPDQRREAQFFRRNTRSFVYPLQRRLERLATNWRFD